tara:strand:- start:46 stop:795 length:750 start_codon:yes stop_codon:yes gene_type:complete
MRNIKGVYWDLDGTLADTEINGHRLAFNMAFKKLDLPIIWGIEEYILLLNISGGKKRIAHYCYNNKISITDTIIDNIHCLKKEFYHQILSKGDIKLRVGVERLIKELDLYKIEQSIVTTSSFSAVNSFLKHILPSHLNVFTSIVSAEDVSLLKPSPEAYFYALSLSDTNKENILAIEDSCNGANAALDAGIKTIITLPSWLDDISIDYRQYEYVISSLGDRNNLSKVYNGPKTSSGYINMEYINNIFQK